MSNSAHYEVLARKYRPKKFSELAGQEHVSRTLQNAISTGRVAHAFLLSGARGVGKTSTARILARALNCIEGVSLEPCNACVNCLEITNGNSIDVFEIDGASNNGVEQVRDLRENVRYLPSRSRYKIFIIDEVHMLSNQAFNALLKTLEEPPEHVKFIFATTEPHKLPITILSRCQRLDFKRITLQKIMERLRTIADTENIRITDASIALVARKGDGSMRDSITALDQVLAFCGESVAEEDVAIIIGAVDRRLLHDACGSIFSSDTQGALQAVKRVDDAGYSMRQFCREMIEYFRSLLIVRSVPHPEELLELTDGELSELRHQVEALPISDLQRRLTLLVKAENEISHSSYPRLVMELTLLKCAMLEPVIPVQELLEKIRVIETDSVRSPSPPWEARVTGKAAHHTDAARKEPSRPICPISSNPRQQDRKSNADGYPDNEAIFSDDLSSDKNWKNFVDFVSSGNPAIASLLEHGSLVRMGRGDIEIAFPAGSYFLTSARDPESLSLIRDFAVRFSGCETKITIVAINEEMKGKVHSLAEKKKRDEEVMTDAFRKEMESHPLVNEALRLFGGELVEIRLFS